jgi:hypothetical protein
LSFEISLDVLAKLVTNQKRITEFIAFEAKPSLSSESMRDQANHFVKLQDINQVTKWVRTAIPRSTTKLGGDTTLMWVYIY